jgi:hypothetical protein
MKPLIDGDIILHELGWSGEFKDKETGEPILLGWDHVQELLDNKIELICAEVGATEPPILFFSDSEWLNRQRNRLAKYSGEEKEFVPGFRYDVAKTKPYKGNRNNPKPYHFYNILAYCLSEYPTLISSGGLEADDEMAIYQTENEGTIICSRDKDLRQVGGWHYSWECGQQRSIEPTFTDDFGFFAQTPSDKFVGYGKKFFYYQMLVGDAADNIPGVPKIGHVKAVKMLGDVTNEKDAYGLVKQSYKDVYEGKAKETFLEQASLIWLRRHREVPFVPYGK